MTAACRFYFSTRQSITVYAMGAAIKRKYAGKECARDSQTYSDCEPGRSYESC